MEQVRARDYGGARLRTPDDGADFHPPDADRVKPGERLRASSSALGWWWAAGNQQSCCFIPRES